MHDPMAVAFQPRLPIPVQSRWRDVRARRDGKRWGWLVMRGTGPTNKGVRVYPWWQLWRSQLVLAGRVFDWWSPVTIWHVEPGGRDAGEVRCELCGRKGHPNVSHQWDGPCLGWWKFRSRRGLYHLECSALVQLRRDRDVDREVIGELVAYYRVVNDLTELEAVDRLTGGDGIGAGTDEDRNASFRVRYRLQNVMGYERDDDYRLVLKDDRKTQVAG